MLTKKQFDVLECLIQNDNSLSQREIAKETGLSLGTVNNILKELSDESYVIANKISEKGKNVMEYYRVKRAIIIAAGFGSRMVPITLSTPKPLVRVKGKRIIDTCLEALTELGIEEIYIVRGYLGEQFDQLKEKFPNIKFIENPLYNEANNISSVVAVGDLVKGSYIIEADLLVYNKSIIKKYQYCSNYLGIPVKRTDDWCFYLENGIVRKMSIGGDNCHQMVGISYWTEEDGKVLAEDVKKVFASPGGKERYWDQVPLEYCLNDFEVRVRECSFDDIIEIDTFNELKQIDSTYK